MTLGCLVPRGERVPDRLFHRTQVAHITDPSLDHVGWDFVGSGRVTSREGYVASDWERIPGFVKILILLEAIIILFMSFWIYQEYLNNPFLQTYVSGYFQGGSIAAIILISIGSFGTVATALYAKLRGARRQLEGIRSRERVGSDGSRPIRGLDTRTEEHLIEMIRKTTPIINSGTADPMPTLRREDSQS